MVKKLLIVIFLLFGSNADRHKTHKMCDRAVSDNPFLKVYCPDKYVTQKMSDEAVDDSLAGLTLIPDWFFANKMIKNLFNCFVRR